MAYFANEIRKHAFKTVHDFDDFDRFEAEMITFGESLPPIDSPTAKDPHYPSSCKQTADWAWERKDTIVPYDQFVAGIYQRKDNRRDQMLKLHEQGMTYKQIAAETGWSAATVGNIIRKARTDT